MIKVLGAYFLPVYLAMFLFVLQSPNHSLEMILQFSWVLVLALGVVWSIAQTTETEENPLEIESVECPCCGSMNSAERLLCEDCLADLFELDDQGNLVPIISSPSESPASDPMFPVRFYS